MWALRSRRPSHRTAISVSLSLLAAVSLGLPAAASATFPGRNGELALAALWCDPGCESGAPRIAAALLTLTPASDRARFVNDDVVGVAYSADGRWLAYVPKGGMRIRSTGGRNRTIALGRGARGPAWAPKGDKLVFARGGHPASLYLAGPATSPRVIGKVSLSRARASYVWSPVGNELATVRRGHLFTLNPRTGAAHGLGAGSEPAWSTDGKRLAVVRAGAITILDRDGRASAGPPGHSPVWLSAHTLLFEGAASTDCLDAPCNDIELFDASTGLVRTIGVGGGISVAPTHKFALFERPQQDFSRFTVVDASGGSAHELATHVDGAATPVWSPDGKRLAAATPRGVGLFDTRGHLRRTLRYGIPRALANESLDFYGDDVFDWQPL